MRLKVSVIVAASDPAQLPTECAQALFEQSLPADDYEVIFAGAEPRHRVDQARGEYVYFLAPGDRPAPDALERMYAAAEAADSDMLVGRIGGAGIDDLFRFDQSRADVVHDGLLRHLGPQILYRWAFLRFLVDDVGDLGDVGDVGQAFVLAAYLRAKVITTLSGEVCCQVAAPSPGASDIGALLDVVDAATEAGSQRDRLYAHWLDVALEWAGRRNGAGQRRARRRLAETLRRIPASAEQYLPAPRRVCAELARGGHFSELDRLVEAERAVRASVRLEQVRWDESVLVMDLSTEVTEADGTTPLGFRWVDNRLLWEPPVPLEHAGPRSRDATAELEPVRFEVSISREGASYSLPVSCRTVRQDADGRTRFWAVGQARLDIGSAGYGAPLETGVWTLRARVSCCGLEASAPLGVNRSPQADRACAGMLAGYPRRLVVPFWEPAGNLAVRVQPASLAETVTLASPTAEVARSDGHLVVGLPVPYVPPSGGPVTELVLRHARSRSREVAVPALIEPGVPGRLPGQLVAKVPARRLPAPGYVGPGAWTIALRTAREETPLHVRLQVGVTGRATLRTP